MGTDRVEHHEARTRTARVRIVSQRPGGAAERVDRLATEEPMEIRVGGLGGEPEALVVTMRTPGDDFDLAAGFLATEGLVAAPGEIESIAYCVGPDGAQEYNVVTVRLRREWDPELRRHFLATSSCGVCGKASIADVEVRCAPVERGAARPASQISAFPGLLRGAQAVFEETGGLHAAGLFDASGELVAVREDVGRHNAVDKVAGEQFLAGRFPLSGYALMVSGRASFEIVQKAAVAGIPVVCAVSAPSSLAVEAGARLGVTVVGFVRDGSFNVYSHPEQVDLG
ncbi:MAG: formate dehydrogenase accessory sulfurtransferase FdhD [Actinobacteria bacterium]|nr:formate dehydrogenase accessory sulfurtransferase FdhD [Actinomycetota bacterium]